ncbi:uncharacterized protein JCM6883_006212 [Sporobolomyces salmoneus]|uniref:uncharacterized protein n=1 Tax=Sporobolomyces salmoneus TaxID=183962 RepID=UPI003180447C
MAGFEVLAPEVIENIFWLTQDSSSSANRSHLRRLQLVSKQFCPIARRLLYRSVHIQKPWAGKKFSSRSSSAVLNNLVIMFVLSVKIGEGAFSKRDIFSDLSQDDILRQTPNLLYLDSPVSSFSPLSDCRRPFASYPPTLKSIRLSPTFHRWSAARYEDEYNSDDTDVEDDGSSLTVSDALSILTSVPNSLTSLTISRTYVPDLSSSPTIPLRFLKSVTFDMTRTPYATLEAITKDSIANHSLKSLKVWVCEMITSENLYKLFERCGSDLEEFTFKPVNNGDRRAGQGGGGGGGGSGKFPALRLVRYTPNLRRLSLGDKAADHTLYPLLPRTLTHLTVSLPRDHINARLSEIEPLLKTRLRKLIKLELYSQVYFPSPEITYSRPSSSEPTGLRELRLSHVSTPHRALESFLSSVGSSIQTLALHHVSSPFSSALFSYCPKLRRLELGRSTNEVEDGNNVIDLYSTTDHSCLESIRVHFNSGIRLDDLVDEVRAPRIVTPKGLGGAEGRDTTYLKTLELVGCFPDDQGGFESGWTNSNQIDELIKVAKEKGTIVMINGKMIETMGDMWSALFNQDSARDW